MKPGPFSQCGEASPNWRVWSRLFASRLTQQPWSYLSDGDIDNAAWEPTNQVYRGLIGEYQRVVIRGETCSPRSSFVPRRQYDWLPPLGRVHGQAATLYRTERAEA